jgi:hypothetical protein
MQASDEATEEELEMARAQGDVMAKALNHMIGDVAEDGQEKQVGDYLVGYAIEEAEGMYMPDENGELMWREPEEENIHVEVSCVMRPTAVSFPTLLFKPVSSIVKIISSVHTGNPLFGIRGFTITAVTGT